MSLWKSVKSGDVFGNFTIVSKSDKYYYVNAECICGNVKCLQLCNITSGNTKSCGCMTSRLLSENSTKHSQHEHRLYKIYYGMKARCNNENNPAYSYYGGRGISVCKDWSDSFESFFAWAITHGHEDKLTLDRVDNSGNYRPENCRFSTRKEQAWNRRGIKGKTLPKGVVLSRGKMIARIRVDGKVIHLGTFTDADTAKKAYEKAAIQYFGCYNE